MYNRFPTAMFAVVVLLPTIAAGSNLVLNGSFSNIGAASSSFAIDAPTNLPDWTVTASANDFLDCLILPGATSNMCGGTTTDNPSGWNLSFYVNPGASPDGGNYVGIDGDPAYANPMTQMINGLSVGTTYTLSFFQAAAQQSGFNGATTERWSVTLGSDTQLSAIMDSPNNGGVAWQSQSMTFKATTTSELLSFLAVGTPNGEPPFVFLDGVVLTTPEPGTYGLMCLAGFFAVVMRKRRQRKVSQ